MGPGWDSYLSDDWYRPIIKLKKIGHVLASTVLEESTVRVIRHAAIRIVLIDNSSSDPPRPNDRAYRERNGKLSRCVVKADINKTLRNLHEAHSHLSDRFIPFCAIGIAWWPQRMDDISEFCRTCIQCKVLGPLRHFQDLLPTVFL